MVKIGTTILKHQPLEVQWCLFVLPRAKDYHFQPKPLLTIYSINTFIMCDENERRKCLKTILLKGQKTGTDFDEIQVIDSHVV